MWKRTTNKHLVKRYKTWTFVSNAAVSFGGYIYCENQVDSRAIVCFKNLNIKFFLLSYCHRIASYRLFINLKSSFLWPWTKSHWHLYRVARLQNFNRIDSSAVSEISPSKRQDAGTEKGPQPKIYIIHHQFEHWSRGWDHKTVNTLTGYWHAGVSTACQAQTHSPSHNFPTL